MSCGQIMLVDKNANTFVVAKNELSKSMTQIDRDNVKVGDIVLLVDKNAPRACWPIGLVTEVVQGRDNLVRSVRIKAKDKVYMRPVTKIVLLEAA